VAYCYNPSYSGDRDQEDRSSKPAPQIVRETLSQKNPSHKRAGGVAQGVGPEFKPQYHKKKKKKSAHKMHLQSGQYTTAKQTGPKFKFLKQEF
jgi:hypothetical protein